jgi:hypothetical protein
MKAMTQHLSFALALLILAGCAGSKPAQPLATRVEPAPRNEIVLVGRIELSPPLTPSERELETNSDQLRNKAQLFLSNDPIAADPSTKRQAPSSMVDLGSDFFVRLPRAPVVYYAGALVFMHSVDAVGYGGRKVVFDDRELRLPGATKFVIPRGANAVYIGTIRYYRDVYGTITQVQVVDDYERARRVFAAKYGSSLVLERISQPSR